VATRRAGPPVAAATYSAGVPLLVVARIRSCLLSADHASSDMLPRSAPGSATATGAPLPPLAASSTATVSPRGESGPIQARCWPSGAIATLVNCRRCGAEAPFCAPAEVMAANAQTSATLAATRWNCRFDDELCRYNEASMSGLNYD